MLNFTKRTAAAERGRVSLYAELFQHLMFVKPGNKEIPKLVRNDNRVCAFTLAEVLITLTIIGVIAALTIPNLLQKYQEEALKTAYKKTYNILNNAYRTVIAETGPLDCYYTYNNVKSTKDCQILFNNLFSNTLKIAKKCENNALQNGCLPQNGYKKAAEVEMGNGMSEEDANNSHSGCDSIVRKDYISNNASVVILNDGQIVIFKSTNPYPIIFVDVNGKKGPNKWGYDIFEFNVKQYTNKGVIPPPLIIPGRTACTLVEKGGKSPTEMYNSVILNK